MGVLRIETAKTLERPRIQSWVAFVDSPPCPTLMKPGANKARGSCRAGRLEACWPADDAWIVQVSASSWQPPLLFCWPFVEGEAEGKAPTGSARRRPVPVAASAFLHFLTNIVRFSLTRAARFRSASYPVRPLPGTKLRQMPSNRIFCRSYALFVQIAVTLWCQWREICPFATSIGRHPRYLQRNMDNREGRNCAARPRSSSCILPGHRNSSLLTALLS
jgi:hypothetical protein